MTVPNTFPRLPIYFNQLSRARRFLERIERRQAADERAYLAGLDEYQDNLYSFFLHCWHVKDWIGNDDALTKDERTKVLADVHASSVLMVCRSIANGIKHLNEGTATIQTTVLWRGGDSFAWDHFAKLDDGTHETAFQLACDAMQEWRLILEIHGLPLPQGW